jgi:hemolysin D
MAPCSNWPCIWSAGVVTPAQQLMIIVPVDSHLEAEAMIANRAISFVSMGQAAEIKIDTFNFTRYGLPLGRVVSVSQDAIVRDKLNEKPGTSKLGRPYPIQASRKGRSSSI